MTMDNWVLAGLFVAISLSTWGTFKVWADTSSMKRARWTSVTINFFFVIVLSLGFYSWDVSRFHKETEGVFASLGIGLFGVILVLHTCILFMLLLRTSGRKPTTKGERDERV